MKWIGRIVWFLAGGLLFAASVFAFSFMRNGNNQTITVSVANSLDYSVRVRVVGSAHPFNIGDLAPGQEIKGEFLVSDVGEGPVRLIVDGPPHDEYSFGDLASGKGPYERFIRLTPGGPVAFFRSPGKAGWCGMLKKESENIGRLPPSLQLRGASTRDGGSGEK